MRLKHVPASVIVQVPPPSISEKNLKREIETRQVAELYAAGLSTISEKNLKREIETTRCFGRACRFRCRSARRISSVRLKHDITKVYPCQEKTISEKNLKREIETLTRPPR